MAACGIPDGATFFADKLTEAQKAYLHGGDIVVVDAEAGNSEIGYRLRRIENVQGNTAYFTVDGLGGLRRNRPVSEVFAKVTHVAVGDAPKGALLTFIDRMLPKQKVAA
jgi:hypothetical protein